jgi:hypothetical protein
MRIHFLSPLFSTVDPFAVRASTITAQASVNTYAPRAEGRVLPRQTSSPLPRMVGLLGLGFGGLVACANDRPDFAESPSSSDETTGSGATSGLSDMTLSGSAGSTNSGSTDSAETSGSNGEVHQSKPEDKDDDDNDDDSDTPTKDDDATQAPNANAPDAAPDEETPECEEGAVERCWEDSEGKAITDDPDDAIGNCKLGERECTEGHWGACVGAVAPEETDTCTDPDADENCNGSANDGCDCTPNTTRDCGSDVGPCEFGVQTCGDDGKWIDECVGGVQPTAKDSCESAGDDSDCDAEENAGCECIGDEVEDCNECGQRTCDPSTGTWGACLPAEESRCNQTGTGVESCNESGNWELEACTNDDPDNCAVKCETTEGEATCVFDAKDNDEDGYSSAACAKAPGDDCDDSTQLVSPGSSETCDGQDNDCDGFVDIFDSSVELAGGPTKVTKSGVFDLRRVDIAWQGSEFALVADGTEEVSSGETAIYAGYARTSGAAAFDITLHAPTSDTVYDSPRLVLAGNTLGLSVPSNGRNGRNVEFQPLSASRVPGTRVDLSGQQGGAIVPNGDEFTVVTTYKDPGSSVNVVYFTSASATGTIEDSVSRDDIPGTMSNISAALAGGVIGATYTETSNTEPSVQLLRLSDTAVILGPTKLAEPAQNAAITGLSGGNFGVTWATPTGFRLQVRGTNGTTVVCDSEDVAFGNDVLDPLDSVAIAQSTLGIVVVVADAGGSTGQAGVFVFDDDCQPRTEAPKALFNRSSSAYQGQLPHLPRLAVGGGNVGIAWTVQTGTSYSTYVRALPETLCQ